MNLAYHDSPVSLDRIYRIVRIFSIRQDQQDKQDSVFCLFTCPPVPHMPAFGLYAVPGDLPAIAVYAGIVASLRARR
ncbi:MAG: hypothetical protein JRJ77_19340 [Deltaproteobacteria bacterium]|nr:hypothetical protein [Deltaproteobacteria bacterium]